MDASADAAALSRSLYAISRARLTGVVTITAHERRCQLLFAQGQVRAALGNQEAASRRCEWLDTAPERVRDRLADVLRWRGIRCRVLQNHASGAAVAAHDSHDMADLLLTAAEVALTDAGPWERIGRLEVTAFGRALLDAGVALVPHVSALELEANAQRRIRAALWIGALVPARHETRSAYGLLLRKREQLRRRVSPRELLELHEHASPDEAGRALRRLAARVHPDALGPEAPVELQGASSELLHALVRAENSLRGRAVRAR